MPERPTFNPIADHDADKTSGVGTIRPVEEELAAISNPTQPDTIADRHLAPFDPGD